MSISISELPTALDLLVKEGKQNHIITFCKDIDEMLNGGIPLNKLTEFCGVPGIGKTQFAFQLAVNACIPEDFSGVGGKTIFIDTEGTFSCSRIREIASCLCKHLSDSSNSSNSSNSGEESNNNEVLPLTVEKVMNSIYYYRVYHYIELLALVNTLEDFLNRNSDVRLIVIDSIAYPFRRDFSDISVRTRSLLPIAQNLSHLAEKFNLAVVLMNQVTTKLSTSSNTNNINSNNSNFKESILIPALGDSWAHVCPYRLILYWKDKFRFCHLYKSPSLKSNFQPFVVNEYGIRGYIDDNLDHQSQ